MTGNGLPQHFSRVWLLTLSQKELRVNFLGNLCRLVPKSAKHQNPLSVKPTSFPRVLSASRADEPGGKKLLRLCLSVVCLTVLASQRAILATMRFFKLKSWLEKTGHRGWYCVGQQFESKCLQTCRSLDDMQVDMFRRLGNPSV